MTQEQATQKANDLNAILSSANVTDQNYQALEAFFNFWLADMPYPIEIQHPI